jgi:membrane protease YdiL (CAAX protease family)
VTAGFLLSQVLTLLTASIVFAAAGWQSADEAPLPALFALQIPLWAGYLALVVYAGRSKGRGVVRDFGLRMRWLDVPVGLAIGVVVQLVVVPLLYWPLLTLLGTDPDELSAPARDLSERAQGPAGWLLLSLMVVVGAPVVEELFYRGLLLRSAQKRGMSDAAAVLSSAVVFGAAHLQGLQFPGLFLFGIVLAVLTVRTGRLGPAVWAHVGFNATTVATLALTS